MRTACGIISDMAGVCPELIFNNQATLLPKLKELLKTNMVNIEVKLHAIITIGDICLAGDGKIYHQI